MILLLSSVYTFFPSFHSSAGQLLFLSMWCVGAPAMCSLDNNICHSRTTLQACRDPVESEVSSWDVCWVQGCPGTLCPGPGDVAAGLHVLWWGLVACRRGFWRSGDGTPCHSASSLKGCSSVALGTDWGTVPPTSSTSEDLDPSCITYHVPHFILDDQLVILLTLGQKDQLHFSVFQKDCL